MAWSSLTGFRGLGKNFPIGLLSIDYRRPPVRRILAGESKQRPPSDLDEHSSALLQMTEVDDGVENQRVAADGLPSVHRVVGEEQYISLAEVGLDDSRMLGHGIAIFEQTRQQQVFHGRVAQNDLGPAFG